MPVFFYFPPKLTDLQTASAKKIHASAVTFLKNVSIILLTSQNLRGTMLVVTKHLCFGISHTGSARSWTVAAVVLVVFLLFLLVVCLLSVCFYRW